MIDKNQVDDKKVEYYMKSEDGNNTLQAKATYVLKNAKGGNQYATLTFDPEVDIETQYDCAFSMLENTMPSGISCCVLGNKASDNNWSIIEDAVIRYGFEKIRGRYIKNFK